MTNLAFTTVSYTGQDCQVSWAGINMDGGSGFEAFIAREVASRLHDEEGSTEFEAHLRGLTSTGFAINSLDTILAAETSEQRDWAIGEAVAEVYLAHEYDITWPWNMERDKRNPYASLPGADLIGFRNIEGKVQLVLGEVKTSADTNAPPSVMNGRSGMIHQIDNLANNLSLILQVLKWLLPRCKGTQHETLFNEAISLFLDSGYKAITLLGVLIRDTRPTEADLQTRGRHLSGTLECPTICYLIAIYLPCAIQDLPAYVSGGES